MKKCIHVTKLGSSASDKPLVQIWSSESSHLFFLLWEFDSRPQTLRHPLPTIPTNRTDSPHRVYSATFTQLGLLSYVSEYPWQTHPELWETTLASIIFPQSGGSTSPSYSDPSESPPPFLFLLLIGAGLKKGKTTRQNVFVCVSPPLGLCLDFLSSSSGRKRQSASVKTSPAASAPFFLLFLLS